MELNQPLSVRIRVLGLMVLLVATADVARADTSFIGPLNTITVLNSTIPSNGDVNRTASLSFPKLKEIWSRDDSSSATSTTR